MNIVNQIPNTNSDIEIDRSFRDAVTDFLKALDNKEMFTNTYESNLSSKYVFETFKYIDAINCVPGTESVIERHAATANITGDLGYLYNLKQKSIGLVINTATTNEIDEVLKYEIFKNRTELEGAQEVLKHNAAHCLKIFRSPHNGALYVLSNRSIFTDDLYKLKLLQNKLDADYVSNYNPLTTDLYDALIKNDVDKFNEALLKIKNSKEFSERNFISFLEKFKQTDNEVLKQLQREIKSNHESILYWENEIAKCGTNIKRLNEQIMFHTKGLKSNENIKDIYNLLNKSPYIVDYKFIDTSKIRLKYYAPLIYYSDYAIDEIYNSYHDEPDQQAILDLFKNKRFQLYTHCEIDFDISDFSTKIHFLNTLDCKYLSHPHINEYGCFGNHREAIDEAAISKNYIGAIDQLSQAVLNMNFYDACVTNKMLDLLVYYDEYHDLKTWYDTETGEFVTVWEAIERSKHEEA